MILLDLFLTFLKIGAVSFGGGYGMISIVRDECLAHGWLTEQQLLDFIAVSESTPGPIAVNMATFVGSAQAGAAGAVLATLGVVLPAFVIMLVIAAAIRNLFRYEGVQAALGGVRPTVCGLIVATAVTMLLSVVFGVSDVKNGGFAFDWKAALIFVAVAALHFGIKFARHGRAASPIILILISGALGVALYMW